MMLSRVPRISVSSARNTEFKKRKKRNTNTVDLPEDLLVEILSRVPTLSLPRFKSISKTCNGLIKDSRFVKTHSANAPRQSLLIMLVDFRVYLVTLDLHASPSGKVRCQFGLEDSLSNSLVDIRNVFHCDGLLLCTTKDKRLVVWNPCSGETSTIQPRSFYKTTDYYALGKSSCNKYKILRLDHHRLSNPWRKYEIYDFTSDSWRDVGGNGDWFIPGVWRGGMSVNGNTYWLASSYSDEDIIISFDFSTERFGSVSLPGDDLSYDALALSVTREDQKLCLLATGGYGIDVWMATKIDQSTGAALWTKLLTVERDIHQQFFSFCFGMNFVVDQENKVLVCRGSKHGDSDLLHIVGEDKCSQLDHDEAGSEFSLLVSYVPTLVQIS